VPKMEPSGLQNHCFGCLVTPKNSTRVPKPPEENRLSNPNAKNCKEPCTPSELTKRRKNIEVRRCRVSVLNNTIIL